MTEAARVRQSARTTTEPDVLVDLARDPSVTVRAALALNTGAPPQVNDLLTAHPDERVRVLLARKLAALVPTLSPADQLQLYQDTWETLSTLVEDEAVHVRAVIAEAIKDLPHAPRGLSLRLAHDTELPVYEPVIRLSPLLTTEDLVVLVIRAPAAGTLLAVARRAGIEHPVTDAIAASMDNAAICALLANPSAQIREAALDALVTRSMDHPDWHAPLVRRPSLSLRSARLLSEIVAARLLEELATRSDLAPALGEELRRRVAARLAQTHEPTEPREPTTEEVLAQAHTLAMRGQLGEEALLEAARLGEARYATALLAVAAGTPMSVVDRAASLRSAKGMISLVWQAGFTMRAAVSLQTLLARLAPEVVLTAGPGGSFPLAVEEMRWQLEFLGRLGH
jgi:uncharacterized protein (DUF2336 family)